jgi:hypothetical protein
MPVRHARSETRGRPPCGRRGGIGNSGSTRTHNGSESSAAVMPVHAPSPTGIKVVRFCYTLLGPTSSGPTKQWLRLPTSEARVRRELVRLASPDAIDNIVGDETLPADLTKQVLLGHVGQLIVN